MVNGPGVPAQKPVEMAFRLEPGISHSLTRMEEVNAQGTQLPHRAATQMSAQVIRHQELFISNE